MSDPLSAAKTSLPMLRHSLVSRKSVTRKLSDGFQDGHLLTLVSAPAGYGKTTTIRMWVEYAGYPVAWVSLEKSDNDLGQFLTHVLTALQTAGEYLSQAAIEAANNTQGINIQQIIALLVDDLHALDQPLTLVLEDYQLIENDEINRFVESIINKAVANLYLVITTREDPDLPLARMRVRNQLTEIRAMDLSFSLEEATNFFSNVMGVNLSTKEIEALKNRTEGWVAGLQLAALSLKENKNSAKFVEAFRGTHRHVLDYLIEEVLNGQPEEVRKFLRQTSILEQMSSALCEAVTGQEASGKHLHYLERNNLFLVPLDEERTWYRYHALFSELLRNQLLQTEPECIDALRERAVDWYEKNGFIQTAADYAFQLSKTDKVFELMEKHALPMLYRGEVSKVMGWFERLPKPLLQSSPILCIANAWSLVLMLRQPRLEKVLQSLQSAQDALNLTDADETLRNLIAGHAASIQAYILRSPALAFERPEKLIETSQKALQLLPENEKAIRSVDSLNIGYGYAALADLPAAERAFKQAFEDGIAGGNLYAAIYGPINLIMIAIAKGQLEDALQLCEANISRFNQLLAGQSFPPIGALYILKGSILLEENHQTDAGEALSLGLSLIRWTGEFMTHIKGYSSLARLYSIQEDCMEILESAKRLEEILPAGADYSRALRIHLSICNLATNKIVIEEAQLWWKQEAGKLRDFPEITGVDQINETRFQTYLNATHILIRLVERNPKAYSLVDSHNCLARQENFAKTHGLIGWLVEIWIARALMYQVEGRAEDAHQMIRTALIESAQRGYFRIFLDEADIMYPLLKSIEPLLKDNDLYAFVNRLLEAMAREPVRSNLSMTGQQTLTERELEVLRLLAAGRSYKEIGQQLFLSLNTVQFHVKNIYSKLSVSRRMQAIEKARQKNLI